MGKEADPPTCERSAETETTLPLESMTVQLRTTTLFLLFVTVAGATEVPLMAIPGVETVLVAVVPLKTMLSRYKEPMPVAVPPMPKSIRTYLERSSGVETFVNKLIGILVVL